MNSKLSTAYKKLEDSRQQLLNELSNVPAEKLQTSPAPGKWSVAQVFYHLNKAESLSVQYINKKKLDVKNLQKTGFKEWLRLLIVKLGFLSPIKFKAPVNLLGDVPEKVSYTEIVGQWNDTRKRLIQALEDMPEDLLKKNVFKQPAAGRVNIYQMIEFMQFHFNRHSVQALNAAKS